MHCAYEISVSDTARLANGGAFAHESPMLASPSAMLCGHRAAHAIVVELASAAFAFAQETRGDTARITVRIDGARQLQQIDGFGASAVVGFEALERGGFDQVVPLGVTYRTNQAQRTAILQTAIRELGATHLRIWLWPPGIEERNDNDDPAVMDWDAFKWNGKSGHPASKDMVENRGNGIHEWGEFLKLAIPLGLKNWIVTPGALPDWLTRRIKDSSDPDRFEEYAEWAAAHLVYLKRNFGFEAPFWSMFNEPDVPGWTSPEFWIAWIKATGARFEKERLNTKIMFPDFMNVHAAAPLTAEVLKNEEARRYIGALAYHHYRSSGDGPQPFLGIVSKAETADSGERFDKLTRGARAMAELGRKYGLPSWQTETAYYPRNIKNLDEWEVGRGRANEIYYELISGASAIEGMCLFWPDAVDVRYDARTRSEGHHILLTSDGKQLVRWEVSKDAGAVFAHYARFVRPGDRRVQAECTDPILRVAAFASDKNQRYVAVAVNNSRDPKTIRFQLSNLRSKPGFVAGLVTDATRTLDRQQIVPIPNQELCYDTEVPPLSLATFVWADKDPGTLTLPPGITTR